jgi:phosphatidylglycerophosphatase A
VTSRGPAVALGSAAGAAAKARAPRLARLVATWFGAGLAPVAPGTVGTAATVPVYLALWGLGAPRWSVAAAALAALAVGVPAAGAVARAEGVKDPRIVVIDEVAGYLFACALLPFSWTSAAVAFALFRALDVLKPGPIGRLERLPGGWGVVMDDVAAGLLAAAIAWAGWTLLGRPPLP